MNKWSLRKPILGDIIRIDINKDYHHYGIYVSDDEVIQYGLAKDILKPNNLVSVLKSNINDFRMNKFVEVREYTFIEKLKKNKPSKVIALARARLGEMKYDIINNNCSHFVNECVFNKHISDEKINK